MTWNLIDVCALSYMAWGAWRGRRREVQGELPGLLAAAAFVFTGWGLCRWMAKAIAWFWHVSGPIQSLIGMILPMPVACALLWIFRKRLGGWAQARYAGGLRTRAGAALGAARTGLVACFAIAWLGLCPFGPLKRNFGERSLIGRTLTHYVVPVYEEAFEKRQEQKTSGTAGTTPAEDAPASEPMAYDYKRNSSRK